MDAEKVREAIKQRTKWEQNFDVELEPEICNVIERGLRRGGIQFDAEKEAFTVTLQKPIYLDGGKRIETLRISEPSAKQLSSSGKSHDEYDQTLRLLSSITSQPLGVLEKLKSRDMALAGALFSFFA
jgi:hypothetical protein